MFRSFRSRDGGGGASSQRDAFPPTTMDSQHRVDKAVRLKKASGAGREAQRMAKLQRSLDGEDVSRMQQQQQQQQQQPPAPSPIVTLTVGREGRLFAAHEDVLCQAPFFGAMLGGDYLEAQSKRIALPDEEPEAFSAVLEYLYKGDYYPRLLQAKDRNSWQLEDSLLPRRDAAVSSPGMGIDSSHHVGGGRAGHGPTPTPHAVEATVHLSSTGQHLLRDTVIYCAAERYGLDGLKRLALRKQGLQTGIDVGTILVSARYCYAHTPDTDSRLRAHYLALIIRCRKTFKRSGTMQAEMERGGGGKLFFDLFVAMCNHIDDILDAGNARTPRTV